MYRLKVKNNLQEKYDRGMFAKQEWKLIEKEGKKYERINN
jgi:hypothetical protein